MHGVRGAVADDDVGDGRLEIVQGVEDEGGGGRRRANATDAQAHVVRDGSVVHPVAFMDDALLHHLDGRDPTQATPTLSSDATRVGIAACGCGPSASSAMRFHDIRHATATLLLKAGRPRSSTSNASSATRMRGRRSTLRGTSANEDLRAPLDQLRVTPIAHDDPELPARS